MKKTLQLALLFVSILLFSFNSVSQVSISDSSILLPSLRLGYSFSFPQQDLKKSMGITSTLNTKFEVKFPSQWIVGGYYNFMFGSTYKDSSMLSELRTSAGGIINENGQFGTYEMLQRGHHGGIYIGRLFPYFSPNDNSGIIATLGCGIFSHKINFNNISGDITQLRGDYGKSYDRFTAGISFTEFLGYQYLSNNRLLNFYGGIEFTQAYTKVRRNHQVDFEPDDVRFGTRKDFMFSVQVGWILPLYKRPPKEFYY